MKKRGITILAASATALLSALSLVPIAHGQSRTETKSFRLLEATIDDIHGAYKSARLTSRQLVQMYLDRIEAYDKKGPSLNAIITVNSSALAEADRLDATFKTSGFVGPLHGIPVIVKDQLMPKACPRLWVRCCSRTISRIVTPLW